MLWCRQVKKSQADTLSIFMRGLLPSLRAFVLSKQPETFRDALNAARLGIAVQNCDEMHTPSNSVQVDVVHTPEVNTVQSTLDTLTGLVSHMSSRLDKLENKDGTNQQARGQTQRNRSQRNNQRPQRDVICWRCGFTGHRRINCYATRDRDGRPLN